MLQVTYIVWTLYRSLSIYVNMLVFLCCILSLLLLQNGQFFHSVNLSLKGVILGLQFTGAVFTSPIFYELFCMFHIIMVSNSDSYCVSWFVLVFVLVFTCITLAEFMQFIDFFTVFFVTVFITNSCVNHNNYPFSFHLWSIY